MAALVASATFLAFLPALQNGFVNWDDGKNFLENHHYRGLGWTQLRWMFGQTYFGLYQPLAWLTLSLDYVLWGMNPAGYHLTSLLIHAANAALFYLVTLRLLGLATDRRSDLSVPAAFAALVFSVHPLRVESVAWVTERRDVVSGFFYLLTLLSYLKAHRDPRAPQKRWLAVAYASFALSLLGKGLGITLSAVLLVLDCYPLGRLQVEPRAWFSSEARSVWLEKVPYALLGLLVGVGGFLALLSDGAVRSVSTHDLGIRIASAAFGFGFYLRKTVAPIDLMPLYEVPVHFDPLAPRFVASGIAVVLVSLALFLARRRWPAGLAAWVCYLITLAPLSGFFELGGQLAADRYSYLSCLGWAAAAGGGLYWWENKGPLARQLALGVAAAVVLTLAALTWRQAALWRDSLTLWSHTIALNPQNHVAHESLGMALAEAGRFEEAVRHYSEAVRLKPDFVEAQNDWGNALAAWGRLDEAAVHYNEALRLRPDFPLTHYNLGLILDRRGRSKEAERHYRETLRFRPDLAEARNGLGVALAKQGNLLGAVEEFRQALRLRPDYAAALINLKKLAPANPSRPPGR